MLTGLVVLISRVELLLQVREYGWTERLEVADVSVARCAQETAHSTGIVVVVDRQPVVLGRSAADLAYTTLIVEHLHVLLGR
jgi:hypothetical protein